MYRVVNEYGELKKVLVCEPDYLNIDEPINVVAEKYQQEGIDLQRAKRQHRGFVEALQGEGVEVILSETHDRYTYQVNTRDLGVTTSKGIIFGRFLLPKHWGEHRLVEKTFAREGIPVFHKLTSGNFEGGDFVYIDHRRAAVGTGIRTDLLGIRGLRMALHDAQIELIPVDFHQQFLHLDMLFNVIAPRTAIICPEALPEDFLALLARDDFTLIEISPKEALEHGTNLLCLGGNRIISHNKIPNINRKLEESGFHLIVLELDELQKSGGGPRCMSFPLLRTEGNKGR